MAVRMKRTPGRTLHVVGIDITTLALVALTAGALGRCPKKKTASEGKETAASEEDSSVGEGQRIFRFDTFGDEQFWTDTLHLNEVVEKNLDATTALKVRLT